MTRHEIETLEIGQTGLYQWDKTLPICRLEPVREVLCGSKTGQAFRYIEVDSGSAKIGFIISEGDKA